MGATVSNEWFDDESGFQHWVVSDMCSHGWHAQPIKGSSAWPGIPDLSAAHEKVGDVWAELKCSQKVQSVHETLKLQHPVTAQQRGWLRERALKGSSKCGVLVAFRTGDANGTIDYVAWCPIEKWLQRLVQPLMSWVLLPSTAKVEWLQSGKAGFIDIINERLVPGWGQRGSAN